MEDNEFIEDLDELTKNKKKLENETYYGYLLRCIDERKQELNSGKDAQNQTSD